MIKVVPYSTKKQPWVIPASQKKEPKKWKPSKDHPWRKPFIIKKPEISISSLHDQDSLLTKGLEWIILITVRLPAEARGIKDKKTRRPHPGNQGGENKNK